MRRSTVAAAAAGLRALDLRVDALTRPLGLGSTCPDSPGGCRHRNRTLSRSAGRSRSPHLRGFGSDLAWDSGDVVGDLPFGIPYRGLTLDSSTDTTGGSVCRR